MSQTRLQYNQYHTTSNTLSQSSGLPQPLKEVPQPVDPATRMFLSARDDFSTEDNMTFKAQSNAAWQQVPDVHSHSTTPDQTNRTAPVSSAQGPFYNT